MFVKVCDAICGKGKTQSCINLMNNDLEHRYIFITPYLTEVERIKTSCAAREFVSPETKEESGFSKLQDIASLLREKKNIASTHSLFSRYTDEIKDLIREGNYILVLDEVLDLFQAATLNAKDIEWLISRGIAENDGDTIMWNDDDYDGEVFNELMNISKSKNLKQYDSNFFFWALPPDVFKCFYGAYVLTYMFEYQLLRHYFKAHDIKYEFIGTKKENGIFQFCDISEMDRKEDLRDKIHILRSEKYNAIGNESYSLSSAWFAKAIDEPGRPKINTLKNNLYNILRRDGCRNADMFWTTIKKYRPYIRGRGYSNAFVSFNKRATNEYSNCHNLAYCLNLYMMPWIKNYLVRIGSGEVNQDMYALSLLIQWIFRSAIRNREEIWIYIPSKRMRWLLTEWLEKLAAGDDLSPLRFETRNVSKVKENLFKAKNVLIRKGDKSIDKKV